MYIVYIHSFVRDKMAKTQTNFRMTEAERRALRMLAGALGMSMTEWTSEKIAQEWAKHFPDMEYPDKNGNIKPKGKEK